MRTQLEKLNNLRLDVNLFYVISFDSRGLNLQGRMSGDLIKLIKDKGFNMTELCDVNNFLEFRNDDNVRITLT
jgi:hypothetical protein